MDKREALELYLKLHNECSTHSECNNCPFEGLLLGEKICILDFLQSKNIIKGVQHQLYMIAKESEERAEKPLVPLENVGSIIIRGRGPSATDVADALLTSIERNLTVEGKEKLMPSSVTAKHDNVNSPKHYCKGGLECIEVIKAQLTPEQYQGYLYGNVLKYMWRWQDKNGLEDLRKAAKYLDWLQQEVKKWLNTIA